MKKIDRRSEVSVGKLGGNSEKQYHEPIKDLRIKKGCFEKKGVNFTNIVKIMYLFIAFMPIL